MSSFLVGRWQYVEFQGQNSSILQLSRGVPQGSILGPLLFIMYMNDIFLGLRFCKCYTYADDIQLLLDDGGLGVDYLADNMNRDLEYIANWSALNYLSLNPSKSKAMYFSHNSVVPLIRFNNDSIMFVSYQKILGLYLDTRLDFSCHVNSIVSRTSFVLRKLYNMSIFLPLNVRKRVALSLCLPFFMYGLEIYSGMSQQNISKLSRCFNRVVRFIYGLKYWQHVSAYVISALGVDFQSYIDQRLILQFYKIIKYGKPTYLLQRFNFGHSSRTNILICPIHSTLFMSRSFVVRVSRLWNTVLPYEFRHFGKTTEQFMKILKNYL